MRLVIVNHEYPPMIGGAAQASARIAAELAASGHDVLVVTCATPGCQEFSTDGRLSVIRVPGGRRSLTVPTTGELCRSAGGLARGLTRWAQRFAADGILAFFAVPAGWLAVRTARKLDLPVIVSLRGSDVPGFPSSRLGLVTSIAARPLIRQTLTHADVVAPNCDHLGELANRFASKIADKLVTIGNGMAPEDVAVQPAGSASGELHVAAVGRLVRRKRMDLTIDVVRRLCLQGVPARLTIIGDGPLRTRLEQMCHDPVLNGRVEFVGTLPRSEVLNTLRRHDVYLTTSQAEGMSNALLEAMASGLPVVTTRNGAHPVVEQAGCGRVVELDDVQGATEALRDLYHNPTGHADLAHRGIHYSQQNTWRLRAGNFAAEFERLLGKGIETKSVDADARIVPRPAYPRLADFTRNRQAS